MKYVIVNGEILKTEEVNLTPFFWNDPLIITYKVWFGFGGVPLLKEKAAQISLQLQKSGIKIPELFLDQRELFRRIKRMLNKNRFYRTGLIHIQLLITNTETNFYIFPTPNPETEFAYYKKGVLVNFTGIKKNSESSTQTGMNQSRFINLLANAQNSDTLTQNSIFLNEKNVVCDTGLANIYFIKKNILIIPSLETGCINDNLRSLIIEASEKIGLKTEESAEIIPDVVYKMDEIFFASESTGLHWVLGIGNKRFVHSMSNKIHNELNNLLKNRVL